MRLAAGAGTCLLGCFLACQITVLPATEVPKAPAASFDPRKEFHHIPLKHSEDVGWDGGNVKYSWQDVSPDRRILYVGVSSLDDNTTDVSENSEDKEEHDNTTFSMVDEFPYRLEFTGDIETVIQELENKVGPAPVHILTEEEMQSRMIAANFSEADYLYDKDHGYPSYQASSPTPYPILPPPDASELALMFAGATKYSPREELKLSNRARIESEVFVQDPILDEDECRWEVKDRNIEFEFEPKDVPRPGYGYLKLWHDFNTTSELIRTKKLSKEHQDMLTQAQLELVFNYNSSRPPREPAARRPGAGPNIDISLLQAHASKAVSEGMAREACPLDLPGLMLRQDNVKGFLELAKFHWKQQEDIEMAERYFRQAVMCDPEDFDMKLEYGMYLMDAKFDYMAAQALFLSVLEKYPKTGYALIGLAECIMNLEQDFQRAHDILYDSLDSSFMKMTGNESKAEYKFYNSKLYGHYPRAFTLLAKCVQELCPDNKVLICMFLLRRALSWCSDYEPAMAAFGCLLVQSEEGEVKDALAQLNQTEEIESRAISFSPMYHLSQVLVNAVKILRKRKWTWKSWKHRSQLDPKVCNRHVFRAYADLLVREGKREDLVLAEAIARDFMSLALLEDSLDARCLLAVVLKVNFSRSEQQPLKHFKLEVENLLMTVLYKQPDHDWALELFDSLDL
mmetsp:Transcript_25387/g.83976  ORF Transcript_25387/g.83976 Transcript_25387/m.83976 type:complete len:682 (-) Transcript_25387:44-2089(-)